MGRFWRKSKDPGADKDVDSGSAEAPGVQSAPDGPELVDGRPISAPLTDADRQRITSALESLATRGVEVDDLASIGAGYDAAFAQAHAGGRDGPDTVVELFGIAIGEHLVRHSSRDWAVVTDVFGTDLGLVAARAHTVIVPHNLVSARWMRGEQGWIPGVVSHLVRLRPRA